MRLLQRTLPLTIIYNPRLQTLVFMPYDTAKNVFIILTLAAIAKNGRTAIYVLSEAGFEIEQIRKYQCEISN